MNNSAIASLTEGLSRLSIERDSKDYLAYLLLLHKWNQAYNLTALKNVESMVSRHLFDSLSILPWIKGPNILDAGSGAGLPGIPLALSLPNNHFVLADSNGKKTRFMQEAKRTLQLDNVDITQTRLEDFEPSIKFDTIVSRAFSDLSKMIKLTQHLLAPNGQWLAMKGRFPKDELDKIDKHFEVKHYTVFGMEEEERCCIIIRP